MLKTIRPRRCPQDMSARSMTRLKVTKKRPQKKTPNIVLNVNGVAKQASPTVHTPTPTRFIRTCEEVGLFQDLQNVNPFEEGFRKALNDKEAGRSAAAEKTAKSDDSLHTPNILPHISNVYSLAEKDTSPAMPEMVEIDEDSDDPDLKVGQDGSKSKLHILQLPERSNESNAGKASSPMKLKIVDIYDTTADYEVRRREMNRKAQQRSRHRRKQEDAAAGEEIAILRNENRKLKDENTHLLSEVVALRKRLGSSKLLEMKRCSCQKNAKDKSAATMDVKPVKARQPESSAELSNGQPTRPVPQKVKLCYKPVKSHLDPSKISKTYQRKERSIMPKISNVWSMATTSTTSTTTSNLIKTKSTPSGFGLDLGNGIVVPLKLAALDTNTNK